jgi:hypothetical protein
MTRHGRWSISEDWSPGRPAEKRCVHHLADSASSYVLGRDRIVELRRRARAHPDFVLADFHQRLLGFSSVSPAFISDATF